MYSSCWSTAFDYLGWNNWQNLPYLCICKNLSYQRDDLESFAYILIYFLCGSLPWQGRRKDILALRQGITSHNMFRELPVEFRTFLESCRSLSFHDKPNYKEYLNLFNNLFLRQGFDSNRFLIGMLLTAKSDGKHCVRTLIILFVHLTSVPLLFGHTICFFLYTLFFSFKQWPSLTRMWLFLMFTVNHSFFLWHAWSWLWVVTWVEVTIWISNGAAS